MAQHARPGRRLATSPARLAAVMVMLGVAIFGALWVPIYARSLPQLRDFPFFYWYQLILVPVTALLCWVGYLLMRKSEPSRASRAAGGGERA